MFWILLEAGIALLVLVLIVWWTLPRSRSDAEKDGGEES